MYQTAPHHAAKLSHLQSILPKGEREVLKEINKFTRELYGQRNVTLEMHNLHAEQDNDIVAVAWSDAALANRADLGSTGGMLIGLVHKDMVDKGLKGPVNVISWGSAKLRRVCRSSLAAETQALSEAEQELMFVRTMWMQMMGEKVNLHRPGETAFMYHSKDGTLALWPQALENKRMKKNTMLIWCGSGRLMRCSSQPPPQSIKYEAMISAFLFWLFLLCCRRHGRLCCCCSYGCLSLLLLVSSFSLSSSWLLLLLLLLLPILLQLSLLALVWLLLQVAVCSSGDPGLDVCGA